jgi:hypothetical protein
LNITSALPFASLKMTNKAKSGGASATAKAKSVRKQPLKAAAAAAPLPGQKKRKGPPQPAKECPDERHAGVDGNMYESRLVQQHIIDLNIIFLFKR